MDPVRDLGAIAALVGNAFADEIDERGRAALREMQWMARMSPLVWWWAQADPSFQDSFHGFVWEVPPTKGKGERGAGQIVGNVSLNRAPGNRRRRIICNVVVLEEYRGRGIGRQLVEAAVAEAREVGAEGVILQAHQDNPRALGLYSRMGFEEVAGETDLWLEAVGAVALLDAPGYRFRPWKPADGQGVYDLARDAVPVEPQWIRPLQAKNYRPDWPVRLGSWLSNLMAGRRAYRLLALQERRLVAMMTVTAAFRRDYHRLELLVRRSHAGQVEAALVSRALHMLATVPPRPVRTMVYKRDQAALKVLADYGFKEQRTLLTLRKDFE
jgi:GNAT superfamily N-acetyltransferase